MARGREVQVRWAFAAAALLVAAAVVWGLGGGSCADGEAGVCTIVGPAEPGRVVLMLVALAGAAYCAVRAVRLRESS